MSHKLSTSSTRLAPFDTLPQRLLPNRCHATSLRSFGNVLWRLSLCRHVIITAVAILVGMRQSFSKGSSGMQVRVELMPLCGRILPSTHNRQQLDTCCQLGSWHQACEAVSR